MLRICWGDSSNNIHPLVGMMATNDQELSTEKGRNSPKKDQSAQNIEHFFATRPIQRGDSHSTPPNAVDSEYLL
jgi:hypothetical protein